MELCVFGVGGIFHSSQIINIDHLIQINYIKSNHLDQLKSSSISLCDISHLYSKIKVMDNEYP